MTFTQLIAGACIAVLASTAAQADSYPSKPITMLVGFSAGGPTDIVARLVAKDLADKLGQPVIVDNKPGVGGNLATVAAKNAAADGYTLLFTASSHALNAGMYEDLPYDPVKDFSPVAVAAQAPSVLVAGKSFAFESPSQALSTIKTKGPELSIATAGGTQLQARMFMDTLGTEITDVAYKGAAPAIADLVGGHVDLSLATLGSVASQLKSGQLKAIAIASNQSSDLLPGVPTLDDLGVTGLSLGSWYGVLAPAGTPQAVVTQLETAVRELAAQPAYVEKLAGAGMESSQIGAEALAALIATDAPIYQQVGVQLREKTAKDKP